MGSRKGSNSILLVLLRFLACIMIICACGTYVYSSVKNSQPNNSKPVTPTPTIPDDKIKPDDKTEISVVALQNAIMPVGELITLKYFYTDAYTVSRKLIRTKIDLPFNTDKILYKYTGVISAGIDINEIDFSVDNTKREITITIPKGQIMHHDLDDDSFRSYDIKNSVFVDTDFNDFNEIKKSSKEYQENKLMKNDEFWNQFDMNTEYTIEAILRKAVDLEGYSIKYVHK